GWPQAEQEQEQEPWQRAQGFRQAPQEVQQYVTTCKYCPIPIPSVLSICKRGCRRTYHRKYDPSLIPSVLSPERAQGSGVPGIRLPPQILSSLIPSVFSPQAGCWRTAARAGFSANSIQSISNTY
ncbi:unnamed protein product, partial [Laminaria digitata]